MPVTVTQSNDELPRRDVTPDKLSKLEKEIDRGRIEIVCVVYFLAKVHLSDLDFS